MADEPARSTSRSCPGRPAGAPRPTRTSARVSHTPFDFTLTFCEVLPLSERDIQRAGAEARREGPGPGARRACPSRCVPNLIAALQEQMRAYTEAYANAGAREGPGALTEVGAAATQSPSSSALDAPASRTPTPSCTTATRSSCSSRRSSPRSPPTRGVNQVTPALLRALPGCRGLAERRAAELERADPLDRLLPAEGAVLIGMARALVERHGGEVPRTMDALVDLPGVGRKTANVVLGHALGVPGLPVDRHVLRVCESDWARLIPTIRRRSNSSCVGAMPPRLDPRVGHAHSARPPHLQTQAAVRAVRGPRRLQFLRRSLPRGGTAATGRYTKRRTPAGAAPRRKPAARRRR